MKPVIILVAGLAAGAVAAAPPAMKPGLWEVTMSMEMSGMPQSMPATTVKHCYRPEEVKDLRKTLPKQQGDCQVSDWKQTGNTASWKMSCSGQMPMTMTGNMTYDGDRYGGVIRATLNHGGQTMNMTQKIDARRLGDCP